MDYKEIKSAVRTFRDGEEPEVFHLIKIRDNEYMVVHEDAYDLSTGKVEFGNKEDIEKKFKIEI